MRRFNPLTAFEVGAVIKMRTAITIKKHYNKEILMALTVQYYKEVTLYGTFSQREKKIENKKSLWPF